MNIIVRQFNPLTVMFWTFLGSIVLTQIEFSNFYDSMSVRSNPIILFSVAFMGASAFLVRLLFPIGKAKSIVAINCVGTFDKIIVLLFIILGLPEFAIDGLPLLTGKYMEFGIPLLHVFVYALALYLLSSSVTKIHFGERRIRTQSYLIFLIVIIYGALILSRHLIVFGIIIYFITMLSSSKLTYKKLGYLLGLFVLFIYAFGVLGAIRMAGILDLPYENAERYILDAGGASDLYINSQLGPSAFWAWLYLASPLYNFAFATSIISTNGTMLYGLLSFFLYEILPETLSKRIADWFDISPLQSPLVVENLNVSTALAGPYLYFGALGVALYIIYFLLLFSLFYLTARDRISRLMISVFFSAIAFLSVFANMLIIPSIFVCAILIIASRLPKWKLL